MLLIYFLHIILSKYRFRNGEDRRSVVWVPISSSQIWDWPWWTKVSAVARNLGTRIFDFIPVPTNSLLTLRWHGTYIWIFRSPKCELAQLYSTLQSHSHTYGHTGDDDVDGKLDLPVGPGGRDGDVVPRVLLREELQGARAGRLVGVLQAVSVPLQKEQKLKMVKSFTKIELIL